MRACLGQVHLVMQIAYGSTNADEIVVQIAAKLHCDALAGDCTIGCARTSSMNCDRWHILCRLRLHPVVLHPITPG